MDYQDQVAIGTIFNAAIQVVLGRYGIYDQPELALALAQELLVKLDQSDYKIERK